MFVLRPGEAMSAFADEAEQFEPEGFGFHNCCCDHVVEQIDAASDTAYQRREDARNRYYECPHRTLTPLEVYLGTLRR